MDIQIKQKKMSDNYRYNAQGVEELFNYYYSLAEMGQHSYDVNAVDLRLDFERALSSTVLTEDEREIKYHSILGDILQDIFPGGIKLTGRDMKKSIKNASTYVKLAQYLIFDTIKESKYLLL